jgi:hypothetical protein
VTDERVERFLWAIRDLGKDHQRGIAKGEDVMQRMGWDPSDLELARIGSLHFILVGSPND